jgi:ribosomal protein S17
MTEYNLTPPTILPSLAVLDAKEKRRKVLEAVRQRRQEIYQRYYAKLKAYHAATENSHSNK